MVHSHSFDRIRSCIRDFDGVCCMQETEIPMFQQRRQITMTKLYHPAIYAQLLAARQELAEAYEQNEMERTLNLSAFIDRLQLVRWAECCLENAC